MARARVTLADSSAWIELLRDTGSPVHARLRELVRSGEEIATTQPGSMELLAGARSRTHHRHIRGALAACTMLSVNGARDWEAAAGIYAACRRRGSTPRNLLDCLIAAVAIRSGVPILAHDRDFNVISEHTPLQIAG